MRLTLLLIVLPFFCFCQSSPKAIVGNWYGSYIVVSSTYPDGNKLKNTQVERDTTKSTFKFFPNGTGELIYKSNSKDFANTKPLLFRYKILPGSRIVFYQGNEKTVSTYHINNDNLTFKPYPISKAFKESIELFFDIKYLRTN